MSVTKTPTDFDTLMSNHDSESDDSGFNRRIALGIVVSLGTNVLLLQGAGALAKSMTQGDPGNVPPGLHVVMVDTPKPTASASPTPLPSASPTPEVAAKREPRKPIVTRKVAPAPRPLPRTVAEQNTAFPTPAKDASATAAPAPQLMAAQVTSQTRPAPTANVAQPASPAQIARADRPLLEPTAISVAGPVTDRQAKLLISSPHTARPQILVGSRSLSAPTPTFVLPADGAARPGQVLPNRGNSASATVAALTPTHGAAIAEASTIAVQSAGPTTISRPMLASRPHTPLALFGGAPALNVPRSGGTPHKGLILRGGPDTSSASAPHFSAMAAGSPVATLSPNAASNVSLQTPNATVALYSEPGAPDHTAALRPGAPGKTRLTGRPTGVPGSDRPGSDAANAVAISSSTVADPGHHPALQVRPLNDDGTKKIVRNTPTRTIGHPVDLVPTNRPTTTSTVPVAPLAPTTPPGDEGVGKTYGARYTVPAAPAIPESLKSRAFDATVTIRVILGSDGQVRARVLRSAGAGFEALDTAAVAAFQHLRFTPALENGSPVDDMRDVTMHFTNKG